MCNPKACSNTSWVRASVLIWFMTSAAACFHEGSAQLGAKNKSNIRFNATGAYGWDNKIINIWISYTKISNDEVPEHFWPKIAGGCLHKTLKPYKLVKLRDVLGNTSLGDQVLFCVLLLLGFWLKTTFFTNTNTVTTININNTMTKRRSVHYPARAIFGRYLLCERLVWLKPYFELFSQHDLNALHGKFHICHTPRSRFLQITS